MSQFDYYQNPNPASREWAPYIVDLQHDLLDVLKTRIMAPLVVTQPSGDPAIKRLNPIASIDGQTYFLSSAELASVPVNELSNPVGNLSEYRNELLAAIDLIFTAV